ncbi:MAG: hypothetical protein A2152_03340 [Candidatus Levybacteria bacterium RBG_16_35_6]|nr:MAG: hypothetical protein A2152_03340 [Candidatus Levybacteria bacterium RBG_16_35_6]
MIGQVIVANTLPILGLLLVNITQPQIAPTATFNTPSASLTSKQEIVWIVKDNETLSGIAGEYYGNSDYWPILLSDNPSIENPNVLTSGWKLRLRTLPLILKEDELKPSPQPQKTYNIAYAPIQPSQNITIQPTPASSFDDVYKEAGEKYGVPWQILYGIHLTETGLRDGTIYNGAGTGARGPMQFMPGTFNAYATDGNGDGQANIDDAKDAIYTAANYLAKHGSLHNGLTSYGGNINGTLNAARERGLQM